MNKQSKKFIKKPSVNFFLKPFFSPLFSLNKQSTLIISAERKQSLGYDWHPECLRCEECGKRLNPGQHAEVCFLRN